MVSRSFWEWAVAAYSAPGVAEACLHLQDDHDQNVPLLLWAAWRGDADAAVVAESVAVARVWHVEVIAPLRQVRRRMKNPLTDGDEGARLVARNQVKVAELAAERALIEGLESVTTEGLVTPDNTVVVPLAALTAVSLAWTGDVPLLSLRQLCQALSDGGFLRYTA